MCLVGIDVDAPEPDFVGFSIEVKSPGAADFEPLRNRLAFSYDKQKAIVTIPRSSAIPEIPLGAFPVGAEGWKICVPGNQAAYANRRRAYS